MSEKEINAIQEDKGGSMTADNNTDDMPVPVPITTPAEPTQQSKEAEMCLKKHEELKRQGAFYLQLYADEVYELMRMAYAGILMRAIGTSLLKRSDPKEIPLFGTHRIGLAWDDLMKVCCDEELDYFRKYLESNPTLTFFQKKFKNRILLGLDGMRPRLESLELRLADMWYADRELFAVAKAAAHELKAPEFIKKLHEQYYDQIHLNYVEEFEKALERPKKGIE